MARPIRRPMHSKRIAARSLAVALTLWGTFATAGQPAESGSEQMSREDCSRALSQERYEDAVRACETFIAHTPPFGILLDAYRELEATYKRLGLLHVCETAAQEVPLWTPIDAYYDLGTAYEALIAFRQAEAGEAALPDCEKPWDGRVQSAIAEVLFAKRDYPGARAALQLAQGKYGGFCGNAMRDRWYRQHVNRGVIHEHLGNYDKAVADYVLGGRVREQVRVIALYEAAGQRNDLLKILEEDERAARTGAPCVPTVGDDASLREFAFRTPVMRRRSSRIQEIRQLEKSRDWSALADILAPTVGRDLKPREEYEITEAANLLAKHPREAVPILVDRLNSPNRSGYSIFILVNALILAGEDGTKALDALYPSSSVYLKRLIERHRTGELVYSGRPFGRPYGVLPFPPIPDRLELPDRCQWRCSPAAPGRPKYVCQASRSRSILARMARWATKVLVFSL